MWCCVYEKLLKKAICHDVCSACRHTCTHHHFWCKWSVWCASHAMIECDAQTRFCKCDVACTGQATKAHGAHRFWIKVHWMDPVCQLGWQNLSKKLCSTCNTTWHSIFQKKLCCIACPHHRKSHTVPLPITGYTDTTHCVCKGYLKSRVFEYFHVNIVQNHLCVFEKSRNWDLSAETDSWPFLWFGGNQRRLR